jgi:hypothetical protein
MMSVATDGTVGGIVVASPVIAKGAPVAALAGYIAYGVK